jgi:sulfur transfer protein SufE
MLLKHFGNRLPSQNVTISKEQMDTLLESVNDLQTRYRDLINLIEEDPELKKYLGNKMTEMNRSKIKL